MQTVLARKWRPRHFQEIVGQTHVVQALTNALNRNHLHHAYLLTGTRGVGKTTIARILAKCFNCEQGVSARPCEQCENCRAINDNRFVDLLEIDAASRTKVEDTREILENVQYAPTIGRYKVYLIDEVHMLSGHSFNALLKTLEEPPAHVKFILATTDPQRLPATVLSRCLQFHLLQMSPEQIEQQLSKILNAENIEFDAQASRLISEAADGSMRDALSLLDQSIAHGDGRISYEQVSAMLGTVNHDHLWQLLQGLQQADAERVLQVSHTLAQLGTDFNRVLSDLLTLLYQLSLHQFGFSPQESLRELAKAMDPQEVQLLYQIGVMGQRDLPFAPTPRIGFEMTVLRMLAFKPDPAMTNQSNQSIATKSVTTTANNVKQNPNHAIDQSWASLLPQLSLTGAALLLAQQCVLVKKTAQTWFFQLDPKQQALFNSKYIARIEQALSQLLGKSIQVNIEFTKPDAATPAELQQQLQEQQQAAAEHAIYNDKTVQRIVQAFDATIVKDSITPHGT